MFNAILYTLRWYKRICKQFLVSFFIVILKSPCMTVPSVTLYKEILNSIYFIDNVIRYNITHTRYHSQCAVS